MDSIKSKITKTIHHLIVWYLYRCGGAFHTFPYGDEGRYVVLMTDKEYGRYGMLNVSKMIDGDFHRLVWLSRPHSIDEEYQPEEK